jgi:phosphatidylinositol alpha-1,6-mannosyltransferase
VEDDRLRMFYHACDLVILPALARGEDPEGFGMVLLEAAAAAKPAVTTRVGGIPEAVEDGYSGVVVEPGDYDALANAVITLLTEEKTRKGMGEAARRRAHEFSWERITEQYALLFASLQDGELRHSESSKDIGKEATIS